MKCVLCATEIIEAIGWNHRQALITRLQGLKSYREREHSINIWYFRAVRYVFNLLHRRGCWWRLWSGWRCTGLEVAGGCEESYCGNIDWKACIRIEKWRLLVIREKEKPGAHNNNNNYTQMHYQSLRYPACGLKKKIQEAWREEAGVFQSKGCSVWHSIWQLMERGLCVTKAIFADCLDGLLITSTLQCQQLQQGQEWVRKGNGLCVNERRESCLKDTPLSVVIVSLLRLSLLTSVAPVRL